MSKILKGKNMGYKKIILEFLWAFLLVIGASIAIASSNGKEKLEQVNTGNTMKQSEFEVPKDMKKGIAIYDEGLRLLDKNEFASALEQFKKAISEFEAVGEKGKVALAAAANNAGNILLLDNKPEEAEVFFKKAIQADPKNALAHNNFASTLLKQGDIEGALLSYQKAIEIDPNLAMAYGNVAEVLLELGHLQKAAKYLAVAAKLQPKNQRYIFLMAKIYSLAGMKDKQQKVWEALVKLSDGSLESKTGLVASYIANGMIEEAGKVIKELSSAYPDSPEVKLQQARLKAAEERWSEAEALLRVLLDKFADDSVVRHDLTISLIKQGRTVDAIKIALEGTQKFPAGAENWFVLGQSYEEAKQLKEAEKAYRKTVEIDPKHAKALNNLGVLAAIENNPEESLRFFSSAVSADPYYTDALYNLGRTLVITKKDYERGVRILVSVGVRKGETAEKARAFINDLEKIADGKDPGWGGKAEKKD